MGATEILLTWGPPQGVRGLMSYEVEWKKKTESEWTKALTKDHRYLLKDLPADTDFDIKVSAYERARKPPPPTPPEEEKEEQEEEKSQYPQDIHVNERSQDELEVTWHPPKAFQNSNLNYLVNCYKVDEQKIHTKIHEVIADTTKCVLDHLEKEVTYKISIWSMQASTQKKKGLPSQTKYMIKEKVGVISNLAEEPQKLRAVSTSYDSITLYWPLPLEGRQTHYYAKYREKSSTDPFKRTYLLLNETEENQVHILNFLNSNTEYVIKIFAEKLKILNEVTVKTLPKHQPRELRAKRVTPFEIELEWEPPNISLRKVYTYTISYHSKNSPVSTVQTRRDVYVLKELVPDVVYTIWVAAEKEGLKGDPTDPIECHTPRCGPQNLQVDALERQIRVYWDEAIVPAETESLNYRVCLQNDNNRAIEGEVLPTPEAKYDYACYFRNLWTDTNYTLVMTTIIDEGDWDPPTELHIKTRRDGLVDGFVQPTKIKAFLGANDIKITWQPPLHTKRGTMMYRIEWREKAKPAAETNKADTKGHTYVIKKLMPNTEYDVRLLAYVPGSLPTEEKKKSEVAKDLAHEPFQKIPEGSKIAQAGTDLAIMKARIEEMDKIIKSMPKQMETVEEEVVFIIVNDLFKKSKPLPILKKTLANLLKLFERDMIVKDDLIVKIHNGGKDDIIQELQKITSRKDFISYSMFMCFIATHGNLEGFNTSDEYTVSYQDLFGLVSRKHWKDFSDKPKIFFIDTCRTRMDKRGLYPKSLQIEELSTHELSVKWMPPEFFEHFELNYLVNLYEIDGNKMWIKKREIVSQEPSCYLNDLNAMTTYKISVWPVLAKTQKKKGWPNHTKYIIRDVEERKEIQMVAASTHSVTISWWLDDDVQDQRFTAKCRKKAGGDEISEELEIVHGNQQTHMIDYLSSNTAYLIGIYIGSMVYLPEVEIKTRAKLQPQNLKFESVQSFEIVVSWEPPLQQFHGISHYLVEYRSKFIIDFVEVSAKPLSHKYECKLTEMEPDMVYKVRVFAEKDKAKGDPTDFIQCRTPKVGPVDLEIKTDTTSISIFWNDAILQNSKSTIAYRLSLHYDGLKITNGSVVESKKKDPAHKYSCRFSDLWTGTQYKLTILTVSDDRVWDPPIIMDVKTKKDRNRTSLEPRDSNFCIVYSDSLTGTSKGTDGWFINSVIKNIRNRYLQHNLEDIVGFILEDIPRRQKKKLRDPIVISSVKSSIAI
ncbi:collagen alpha-1(XII) chain-like [Saccostrea echinata]|uniref:collagen alpha-1(XII) chain-like n=1 Tax=Saccostrea echinata TaxID=191078 RepID=UPI002A839C0F|nr:collagen alpha-1(XII) chain-like [Saccostrea echinata]